MKFNLNQRKTFSDILNNLLVVIISVFIINNVFYEKNFDRDSIMIALTSLFTALVLTFVSVSIVK